MQYIYIYISSYIMVYLYIYTHTLFALQSFVTPSAPFVSVLLSACRSTEAKKEGCKLIRSLGRRSSRDIRLKVAQHGPAWRGVLNGTYYDHGQW